MSEQKSTLMPIIGAIVFALIAAGASYFYLQLKASALEKRQGQQIAQVTVLVPRTDLPRGAVLGANNLTQRPIDIDLAHDDVVTGAEFETVRGRLLVQPLGRGRPLLRRFVESSGANQFSDTITAGHRGITIQIDEINSFDGMLRPGDRIDLYLRLDQDDLPAATIAEGVTEDVLMPVMQDLLVMATGTEAHGEFREKYGRLARQRRGDGYSTVTVDVTPKEGALLSTAEEQGELVAMLRNRKDRSLADFDKVLPSDLFAYAREMAEKAAQQAAELRNRPLTRDDIIINADGTVTDKYGNPILGPDGKPLTKDDVVFNPDGTLAMKGEALTGPDGSPLTMDDVTIGADGILRDKDGNPILGPDGQPLTEDDVVINPDGSISTRGKPLTSGDQGAALSAEDITIGADGILRDKDGNPILGADGEPLTKDDVVFNADGSISVKGPTLTGADGQPLSADDVTIGADGVLLDKDGNPILGPDGQPLTKDDVVFNEDGTISMVGEELTSGLPAGPEPLLGADGEPLSADDIQVGEDGIVRDKDGKPLTAADIEIDANGNVVMRTREDAGGEITAVDFLAGGNSKNGVAELSTMPVLK
ncbi:MAG: Flp pilus assembly protein CpaB [Gammaproteobacteria bacterium]